MADLVKLRERPDLADAAALWFSDKFGVPLAAYVESIGDCIKNAAPVPEWYVALEPSASTSGSTSGSAERIVGGLGVIENDFHPRTDLAPNVCAVYVEPDCRKQGIAGRLLALVASDMADRGVDTLYLVTDHTSFYERCGWQFLCTVLCDGEDAPSRVYVHRQA